MLDLELLCPLPTRLAGPIYPFLWAYPAALIELPKPHSESLHCPTNHDREARDTQCLAPSKMVFLPYHSFKVGFCKPQKNVDGKPAKTSSWRFP